MGDFLLRTGDELQIAMAAPVIVPIVQKAVPLLGSSRSVTAIRVAACLKGDELPPALRVPVPYVSPPFTVGGTGTFVIALPPAHFTSSSRNGLSFLLKGAMFPVTFTVQTPATNPVPVPGAPKTDPVPTKAGTGVFITRNTTVRLA